MDIIQGMNNTTKPRLITDTLVNTLKVMPAVIVTGARQTGKSTLVNELTPGNRDYFSLDDLDVMDAAKHDPDLLVRGTNPVTLDEIQREPSLLHAVKQAIDSDRKPGQFLLTGSANLLLMRKVSESLAGRASYLTLWPMTRHEQMGLGKCGFWEELISTPDKEWIDLLESKINAPEDWKALARRGGFPTPAIELKKETDRTIWFNGYVKTYLERDLQDLSSVSSLPDFRRLMRAVSLRLGQLGNQTDLGRDVSIPQATVHRYLNLLEASYMLVRLPAYAVNRTKRLIKSPKLYWGDTGVALSLADGESPGGAHLENLVLNDLLVWKESRIENTGLFYWRTTTGEEVDLVIESGNQLVPIEVKSSGKPQFKDTRHLHTFKREYPHRSRAGLLIHTGKTLKWIAPGILAVPWWKIF